MVFFFQGSAAPGNLRSFPTRRSSDLSPSVAGFCGRAPPVATVTPPLHRRTPAALQLRHMPRRLFPTLALLVLVAAAPRSEEHTSELQSQSNLVCRLLLEKKIYLGNTD